ncbi:peptidylprolyl isomerase [Roseivirga sp.]|uniref:peptidylprolyl isomerase n=1 Tax=Roseivirga sp. TaxID=1964215 RepID=UPI003B527318
MRLLFIAGIAFLLHLACLNSLFSQTIASIDDVEISSDELLYAYNKNRPVGNQINRDSLLNYLEQYINFKLKVREARKLGLDTLPSFQNELQGYLSQIKKPYLENPNAEEDLIKETYRHMQTDINAAHILIKVSPTALPQDTLSAYNFLDSLRQTIGSRFEFEEMARKYSQDGSAQAGGNLGWFTALQMVPPFEDGAYNTPINKVSEVVRSSFGYHLIYVIDKRENLGKVRTSHLFFSKQRGSEAAKIRAEQVYDSLMNGSDWDRMARKFSDDTGTKNDGGRLPWAGVKQLPDDYLEIVYNIEELGAFTKPSETQFGWHIIKLNDIQPLEPYEIKKPEIAATLKRMGRNTLDEKKLLSKLKSESNFNQNLDSLNLILNALSSKGLNDAYTSGLEGAVLFRHGNQRASLKEFLEELPAFNIQYSLPQLTDFYQKFEKEFILSFEDSIAPTKYPEYRFLQQEYEEGLLLFEIMQQRVWDKAAQDSLGLKQYYEDHQSDYIIEDRIGCLIVQSPDQELQSELKAIKFSADSLDFAQEIVIREINDRLNKELKFAKRNLLASEFSNFEGIKKEFGSWTPIRNTDDLCLILEYLPKGPQAFEEIKGLVMADFQELLETQWVEELRSSAEIKINKKELKAITKN